MIEELIAGLLAAILAMQGVIWYSFKNRLDHLDECVDSLRSRVCADHADFREKMARVETKLELTDD